MESGNAEETGAGTDKVSCKVTADGKPVNEADVVDERPEDKVNASPDNVAAAAVAAANGRPDGDDARDARDD